MTEIKYDDKDVFYSKWQVFDALGDGFLKDISVKKFKKKISKTNPINIKQVIQDYCVKEKLYHQDPTELKMLIQKDYINDNVPKIFEEVCDTLIKDGLKTKDYRVGVIACAQFMKNKLLKLLE